MALPTTTTALRSLSCHSCRQWALRSFVASIGGPGLQQPTFHRRQYTPSIRHSNGARERIQQDEHALNDINDVGKLAKPQQSALERLEAAASGQYQSDADEPSSKPAVPWYLQLQHQAPTVQPESPMAARQRIPDLPPHPPPLLQPLLNNISVDQGLDDLNLLDLRTLDPPPALGSNLLMIIGTARSEKHLHVSADRLCRWLRTEYKIHPYADGLLGRNELKLKLRRKAKRTRLMSSVGAKTTSETELDEGIRTGWVCVNVGRVEGGALPEMREERERRQASVVGFGTQEGGCSVVVQMMTEEKRGEVDLEKLWMGMLNRARKERELSQSQGVDVIVEGKGEGGGEGEGAGADVGMQELDGGNMPVNGGSTHRDVATA